MVDATHIQDYRDRALALLPSVFDDAANLRALLAAFADGVQQLETRLAWPVMELAQTPDGATGSVLDLLGRLAIEPRRGRVDARYRAAIEARALTNQSNGEPTRLARILELLLGLAAGSVRSLPQDGAIGFDVESSEVVAAAERGRIVAQLTSAAPVVTRVSPVTQGPVGTSFTLDVVGLGLDDGELCEQW